MKYQPVRYKRERSYPMSVAEAWRLLADTDHLNRAIGLPRVAFSSLAPSRGEFVRQGHARLYGIVPVRWKEYPFAWVRERCYKVRREFESGPVAVLEGNVELQPADAGVRVRVFADFTPSNVAGKFLWRAGAGVVNETLEFCDRYLSRKQAGEADAVPVAGRPAVNRQRLEE